MIDSHSSEIKYGLTGNTRFRQGKFGGLVLQVECRHEIKHHAEASRTWRDATVKDLTSPVFIGCYFHK